MPPPQPQPTRGPVLFLEQDCAPVRFEMRRTRSTVSVAPRSRQLD